MAKKVKAIVKIQLPAGKATPAPPIGPALGQHGVNIMAFCKEYNDRTGSQEGSIIPVGRKSKLSLYREDFATFGQEDVYEQSDAEGFIHLYGLPLKVRALNELPVSGLNMPKPDYSRFKRD